MIAYLNMFLTIAILTIVVTGIAKVIYKKISTPKVDVDMTNKDVQHEHDVIKKDFTAKPVKF